MYIVLLKADLNWLIQHKTVMLWYGKDLLWNKLILIMMSLKDFDKSRKIN